MLESVDYKLITRCDAGTYSFPRGVQPMLEGYRMFLGGEQESAGLSVGVSASYLPEYKGRL